MARSRKAAARRCSSRQSTTRNRGRWSPPRSWIIRCPAPTTCRRSASPSTRRAARPIRLASKARVSRVRSPHFRRSTTRSTMHWRRSVANILMVPLLRRGCGGRCRVRRDSMSDYEHILVEIEDGVGIITMNRPDKLNAMNRKLSFELRNAVKAMDANDDVGCIVITGAGRAFSAGGDIHEQREDDRKLSDAEQDARRTRGSFEISACAKPTIGMMNGLAYGGAAVVASALDMRIGCEHTKFRFLAAAYGRINSTWTLPNQVGWPMAKELLFSARVVEAEEAWRIGLLNHLVPREQLRAKTMELARTIAGNNRAAVIGIKALLLKQMTEGLEEQWAEERHFTTHVVKGAKAEDAFPDFIARKGRPLDR